MHYPLAFSYCSMDHLWIRVHLLLVFGTGNLVINVFTATSITFHDVHELMYTALRYT
jgi:hypothetical protein